jgi:phosphatidylinositol alpha-1,6-mannosyltransferase
MPLHLNKYLYQFSAAFKGLELHKKYKFDGMWALMAHSAGVPAAIFNMFQPKVPYLLTLQEGDPTEYIEKVMKPVWPLFSRAFTQATAIQAISSFLRDWAYARGFKGEVNLIHNGANPRDLHPTFSEEEIKKIKKELGKKEGDVFLVNTARLVHQKAFDITIKALPMLPAHVKLVIVGGGDEREMLQDLVKELKLEDRVIFVGQVDRSVVTLYRKASDIFVCASRSEGLGNAFLSAMASRLPVIATREGGLSEFMEDGKTGWVVEKDNPEQIAAAVKDILEDREKVGRIAETAQKMVFEEYNWDRIGEKMRQEVFKDKLNI